MPRRDIYAGVWQTVRQPVLVRTSTGGLEVLTPPALSGDLRQVTESELCFSYQKLGIMVPISQSYDKNKTMRL